MKYRDTVTSVYAGVFKFKPIISTDKTFIEVKAYWDRAGTEDKSICLELVPAAQQVWLEVILLDFVFEELGSVKLVE